MNSGHSAHQETDKLKWTRVTRPFFITASKFKNAALNILFPPRCVSCGRWMSSSTAWQFCSECMDMLEFVSEPYCEHCGIAIVEDTMDRLCLRCSSETDLPAGLTLRSLLRFDGPIQEMLHTVKYRRKLACWPTAISAALTTLLPQEDPGKILITSIPLHKNRLRQRGFNLPDYIAYELARASGIRCNTGLLERERDTESQVGKSRPERLANMAGAFKIKTHAPASDRLIVLVDDVITTGATMAAAAAPFLANGNRVLGISPARAY